MNVFVWPSDPTLRPVTRTLLRRMVSPLCGMDQRISFMIRGRRDPRLMTAGGELTGVHLLRGQPRPGVNTYHIGGGGILLDEPLIRVLGESLERYAQLVSGVAAGDRFIFASHSEMRARGHAVPGADKLLFFDPEQHAAPGLPFDRFNPDAPMSWTPVRSLVDGRELWAPAQLLLVGYVPRKADGEPWLSSAVTTGSAAHTDPVRALRSCMLELIQIDAVMGHWYTAATAPEIVLDGRVPTLRRILERYFDPNAPLPRFYAIPSADLPGFVVACIVRDSIGVPAAAAGLGCDTGLEMAIYKALLEAVSVVQLAKITLLYEPPERRRGDAPPESFTDFDSNVAFYSRPGNDAVLDRKFGGSPPVRASDLPADPGGDARDDVRRIIGAFRAAGLELTFNDLTTADLRSLGFQAFRVWSPDLVPLSLPGFPTRGQPRFRAYGAPVGNAPHPYP